MIVVAIEHVVFCRYRSSMRFRMVLCFRREGGGDLFLSMIAALL
jgi:hypothetical protein